jgi:hypothetical protein
VLAATRERFPQLWTPGRSDLCFATTNRQSALMAMAPRCDAVVVLGAIVGGIAGGGTGAGIGALVGGAGGTIIAASGQPHLKIPAETRLQFQLTADWKVQ